MEQQELWLRSQYDGSMQPSLFYESKSKDASPLLVGLHTWSYDRFNQVRFMLPIAEKYGFHLLLPEFRGANKERNPIHRQACASKAAMQDIIDATEYVTEHFNVDRENIFLLGGSGGGHMALMMAGNYPDFFKAIASFCPITDLVKWSEQNEKYRNDILACCNNDKEEMIMRSPISYVDTIAKANVKIFHGKNDRSVPVSHSIELFQMINEKYPKSRVYLDIFDGIHEVDFKQAMYWLLSQYSGVDKKELTS